MRYEIRHATQPRLTHTLPMDAISPLPHRREPRRHRPITALASTRCIVTSIAHRPPQPLRGPKNHGATQVTNAARKRRLTDANGKQTEHRFNGQGYVVKTTDALGRITTWERDIAKALFCRVL